MLKRFLARLGLRPPEADPARPDRPRSEPSSVPSAVPPDAASVIPQDSSRRAVPAAEADPAGVGPPARPLPVQPYGQAPTDLLYNLLFCDDPGLFGPGAASDADSPLGTLAAEPPDVAAIEAIALDPDMESRVRALAFNRLRALGRSVPAGELLGVVIEVPLEAGLDTLAVYVDHRIRYIDHAGRLSVLEDPPVALLPKADELLQASRRAMERIGPWDEPRRPPPPVDSARMTFIASDGLYLGEGPFDALMREPLAAPIIQAAGELLEQLVGGAADGSEAPRPPA